MLFSEDIYRFMYSALQEAEKCLDSDDVPVGAVVVYKNRIIGRGYNQNEKLKDATAHAEMIAITAASNHLQTKYLEECDLYVTLEPCLMCTGAIFLSRIRNLFFGAFEPKFGACGSIYNIPDANKYNHSIKVYSGIYADESKNLLQNFFEKIREKKNNDK